MLNLFIRIIRIPIAIPASVVVFIVMIFAFVIETTFALPWLILLSIISDEKGIHDSWVGSYPNSIKEMFSIITEILTWSWDATSGYSYDDTNFSKNKPLRISILLSIEIVIFFLCKISEIWLCLHFLLLLLFMLILFVIIVELIADS